MLTSSKIMLTRYNINIFFEKYIVVGTSMQKIRIVALSVQKLGCGGSFYPPPPIRLAYIKNPIQNRDNNKVFCVRLNNF